MISKYKKISIIYGGTGLSLAKEIDEKVNRMHEENMFPVDSNIIAKRIMSGMPIFVQIKKAIEKSDLCIIILTFDDIGNTRVRQNVLIEIGMALMTMQTTDRCIFLTEKFPLPEDFPSDLNGWINANGFDKNSTSDVVENLVTEIKELLKLKSHKDILNNDSYDFDYERVLDDIPDYVFEKKADVQLHSILDCWLDGINSFGFVCEKIIYLLERLKFFPDFNCNERFFEFIGNVKRQIRSTEKDRAFTSPEYLTRICGFTHDLLDYTDLKLHKEVILRMSDPKSNMREAVEYADEFKAIAGNIKSFIDYMENGGENAQYNWLVRIMAYEYAGLALMKTVDLYNIFNDTTKAVVEKAIEYYKKMLDVARVYGGTSENLWRGYAEYDLTRAYEALYKISGDKSYFEYMRKYSHNSIVTRKYWCKVNAFRGVFTNALSFEYFLVKKHELELSYNYPDYANLDRTQLSKLAQELSDELKQYYDSSELGRLYDMKSNIDEFLSRC